MQKSKKTFYIMLIPSVILFFVFHTIPFLSGLFYSFTNWKGYGEWDFIGLTNYINLFKDPRIINSYLFTFKFAIVSSIIINVFSLLIALGLNAKIKFKNTLRAIYFIPNILGVLIVGYIFNFIFSKVVTQVGGAIGSELLSRNILGDPNLAWIGVVIVTVWQAIALNTIIYLSGLQTIPGEVYEAAAIDGASAWANFKHITFPLIAPFFTINMVLAMKNCLMAFDQVVSLTGGGPAHSTEVISVLIYKGGFEGGQFAYQLANGVIFFIVIVTISVIQLRVLEKREAKI